MLRSAPLALILVALFAFGLVGRVAAEEPAKEEKIPLLASDEQAAEALKVFKKAFKARGFKGEEKIAEQDWAMRELAKVQHPKVVTALVKVTKNRDAQLRTGALLQLGNQRRIPGFAGKAVLAAMARNAKDDTFTLAGLEAISKLKYMGAKAKLIELMKHPEYAVVKNTLVTVAALKDARFIEEIVKLMKELKLEKGAKWDGVNVTYDTGTAGDHDQKMAEKIGKAQEAKNKRKGKRAAKSMRDLGPIVLEVMFDLTGQQFSGGIEARKWLKANRKDVDARVKKIDDVAQAQAKEAAEMKKRR